MKYSQEIYKDEAQDKLLKGAKRVYDGVSTTLGIQGRNVIIHKNHKTKTIHDGVKTAMEILPKDPFEAAGANILKQAGERTADTVGDGTTVSTVLGYWIAKSALKIVRAGVNPMKLRFSLEKGRDLLVDKIQELSSPITSKSQKIDIATISAQEENMGRLIGETYHKAGTGAVIVAEQINSPDTYVEHQEGMQIDSGYKVEHFVTNKEKQVATVVNAVVFVTNYTLNNIYDIQPLFKNVIEDNKKLNIVVFAQDIQGNVLATLVNNKMKGTLATLAVKAPTFQSDKYLQDIAIVVGATFVSKDTGMDLKELTLEDMGFAERITSSKHVTTIVGGAGKKKDIEDRVTALRKMKEQESNAFDRVKLDERIAKLTGGVFTIKAGGYTDAEAEDRYEKADDSIKATRAAIEGGVVPGGEVVYLEARKVLVGETEMEEYAYRILYEALEQPFNKLVTNAGLNPGRLHEKLENKKFGTGVDLTDEKIKDLTKAGIIDPAMVATESIKNAVSVAVALITAGGVVVEKEDEK